MTVLEKQLLRPIEMPDLIRLGRIGDGGYVVPASAVERSRVLLSLGMNDEWSFDRDFLARNPASRLIGVDHSVGPALFAWWCVKRGFKVGSYTLVGNRAKAEKNRRDLAGVVEYFHIFGHPNRHIRRRVAAEPGRGRITIGELIRQAGPAAPLSLFLKMDIEGGEYDVVSHVVDNAQWIACVAAEVHDVVRRAGQCNAFMHRMLERFHVAHVHGNNFGGTAAIDDGFPCSIELTLVNRELVPQAVPSRRALPLPGLDFPNYDHWPEVPLRFD